MCSCVVVCHVTKGQRCSAVMGSAWFCRNVLSSSSYPWEPLGSVMYLAVCSYEIHWVKLWIWLGEDSILGVILDVKTSRQHSSDESGCQQLWNSLREAMNLIGCCYEGNATGEGSGQIWFSGHGVYRPLRSCIRTAWLAFNTFKHPRQG